MFEEFCSLVARDVGTQEHTERRIILYLESVFNKTVVARIELGEVPMKPTFWSVTNLANTLYKLGSQSPRGFLVVNEPIVLGSTKIPFISLRFNQSGREREQDGFLLLCHLPRWRILFQILICSVSWFWVEIGYELIENEGFNLDTSLNSTKWLLISWPRGQLINETGKLGCLYSSSGLFLTQK